MSVCACALKVFEAGGARRAALSSNTHRSNGSTSRTVKLIREIGEASVIRCYSAKRVVTQNSYSPQIVEELSV